MTDKRIVLSTAGSQDEARKIAHHLVERQLAACVNIVPRIESIYRWKGKVETSEEWLLLIKTTAEKFPQVRDAIRQLHSYDFPECVAISIEDGSADYLEWISDSSEVTGIRIVKIVKRRERRKTGSETNSWRKASLRRPDGSHDKQQISTYRWPPRGLAVAGREF
jgi:periplasmic divalent cation tolerance protein